jgi:hypothetical protein
VPQSTTEDRIPRIYDGEGDLLMQADRMADRIVLMPAGDTREPGTGHDRIRIQWGQHLLADLAACKYRTLVVGVNDIDNSRATLGRVLSMITTSQWTEKSATAYAKMFHESNALLGHEDREPYVLKYDLDRLLVLGILRPKDKAHFTLADLHDGFKTITKMVASRYDRWPVASVSFLCSKNNPLVDAQGHEPSFEAVLRTMYEAGYRGDVYPAPPMWQCAPTGVYTSYPFPESLDDMRRGGY